MQEINENVNLRNENIVQLSRKELKQKKNSHHGFQSLIKLFRKNPNNNFNSNRSFYRQEDFDSNDFDLNSIQRRRPNSTAFSSTSCDSIFSTSTEGFLFYPSGQCGFYESANQHKTVIAKERINKWFQEQNNLALDEELNKENIQNNPLQYQLSIQNNNGNFSLPHTSSSSSSRITKLQDPNDVVTLRTRSYPNFQQNRHSHVKGKRKAPAPPPASPLSQPNPSTLNQPSTSNTYLTESVNAGLKTAAENNNSSGELEKTQSFKRHKPKRKAPLPPPPPPPPSTLLLDEQRQPTPSNSLFLTSNTSLLASLEKLFDEKELNLKNILVQNSEFSEKEVNSNRTTIQSDNKIDQQENNIGVNKENDLNTSKITVPNVIYENNFNIPSDYQSVYRRSNKLSDVNETIEASDTIEPIHQYHPIPWYKRSSNCHKDYAIPIKNEIILKSTDNKRKMDSSRNSIASTSITTTNTTTTNTTTTTTITTPSTLLESLFMKNHYKFGSDHKKSSINNMNNKRKSVIGMPNISELDREAAQIVKREYDTAKLKKEMESYFYSQSESTATPSSPSGAAAAAASSSSSSSSTPSHKVSDKIVSNREKFFQLPNQQQQMQQQQMQQHQKHSNDYPKNTTKNFFENTSESKSLFSNQSSTDQQSNRWKSKNDGKSVNENQSSNFFVRQSNNFNVTNPYNKLNLTPNINNRSDQRHQTNEKSINTTDDEKKRTLIDSSAVIKTIIPVFQDTTQIIVNSTTPPQLQQQQQQQITPLGNPVKDNDTIMIDNGSIEKEKQRLRKIIREMNAKALAEKYPIIDKSSPIVTKKLGATPKIPKNIEKNNNNVAAAAAATTTTTTTTTSMISPQIQLNIDKSNNTINNNYNFTNFNTNNSDRANNNSNVSTTLTSMQTSATASDNKINNNINTTDIDLDNIYHKLIVNKVLIENKLLNDIQEFSSTKKFSKFKDLMESTARMDPNKTNTIALKQIMKNLEIAISDGNDQMAAKLAMDLAKMKVSLSVSKHVTEAAAAAAAVNDSNVNGRVLNDNEMENVTLQLFIADNKSHKGPINIIVSRQLNILELKQNIYKTLNIPVNVQIWIINDILATEDGQKIQEFNIVDKSIVYLYITDPGFHLNINLLERRAGDMIFTEIIDKPINNDNNVLPKVEKKQENTTIPTAVNWVCPLCTLINPSDRYDCLACSKSRPIDRNNKNKLRNNQIEIPKNNKYLEIKNRNNLENKFDLNPSPNITRNKYRGVDNFNPKSPYGDLLIATTAFKDKKNNVEESVVAVKIKNDKPDTSANTSSSVTTHYMELLQLEDAYDVIPNNISFECPICLLEYKANEGIILRDCFHTFCKECIVNTIQFCTEPVVKCPYMDADYSCQSLLQDREIRAMLTKQDYDKHLAKSVQTAEHTIANAFHCKTPNCKGWCIYEDNVNQFKCPICKITNCLTCRVVHDGLNCKQYQDGLNSEAGNVDIEKTKDMLSDMIDKGDAMKCPTCQVILMKKWGCDWLKCSMCKTEICWVTRNARWGPAGKGDISGGCRCGVDGKKCHIKCNYCH